MDPERILVVATRRIGDVLLTTPLVRSLRRAYPGAVIDVLVFAGKGEVLRGNPDCSAVIEVAERPSRGQHLRFLAGIFRRYDLGIATQQSDRSHLYALFAARRRVGIVPDRRWSSAWKRASCFESVELDDIATHTVVQNLRLADRLGITRHYEVVVPEPGSNAPPPPARPYAVVHPGALFLYKKWTQAGWGRLIGWLKGRGLAVAISRGPDDGTRLDFPEHAGDPDVIDLPADLSLPELGALIRRARLYVGPDTAVTHLAAACGTPTLALFGPSNPVKWGPWPPGAEEDPSPWRMLGRPWQRSGNVLLLQGTQPGDLGRCVPCRMEGCERHRGSASRCMTELPADVVIRAAASLMDG